METYEEKKGITTRDLENPQRFIAEGLGAPEAKIMSPLQKEDVHCLYSN